MNALHASLYGFFQGATEFLPVSSSAHLALLPHYLGINDPGVVFDLTMHLGTTGALLIYFRKEIVQLLGQVWPALRLLIRPSTPINNSHTSLTPLTANLILANVISVLAIVLLKGLAEQYGRNINFIAVNLVVFGLLLFLSDFLPQKSRSPLMAGLHLPAALTIGIAQAIAIFPGVSRSGITITTARLFHLSKEDAAQFSFFLAIPIILLACTVKIGETLSFLYVEGVTLSAMSASLLPWLVGLASSLLFGLLTIHYFMKLIRRIPFLAFGIYRLILAVLVLTMLD